MRLFAVLIVAAALAAFPAWAGGGYRLGVTGLSCPFCAYGIEKELSALKGVDSMSIDIAKGEIKVVMKPGAKLTEAAARKAAKAAGFGLRSFEKPPGQ